MMNQVNGGLILPSDPDKEDLEFLASGGATRRIGIPIGLQLREAAQHALYRAQNNGWVVLVDMDLAIHKGLHQNGPMMTRVFRVTDAGMRRVNEIKQRRGIDLKTK